MIASRDSMARYTRYPVKSPESSAVGANDSNRAGHIVP
jgi:hypothetical protein